MLLVVFFHLWPQQIRGGFIGVDVFFVISGFLITGHLLREGDSTSGIYLPAFWARRIRRLLPAAFLVLAVSLIGTVLLLPVRLWQDAANQIAASAVGIQNWVLAGNSVDYFAADNQPTVVQHYWSLSLEEQFYLVWPVLLFVLYLIARRLDRRRRRVVIGAAMGVVFTGSLAWSIVYSYAAPNPAYFSTFTHGWELAAGGILALVGPVLASTAWGRLHRARAIATWAGLVVIVASAFVISGTWAFPGWIALLPVAGALAVIAAGHSESRIQRVLLLGTKPVQLVGNSSYSVYLWHWPFIVVVPYVLDHPLGTTSKLAILAVSLVLGWLTKRFVEDPARRSRALNYRLVVNYVIAAGSAIVIVLGSTAVLSTAQATELAAQKTADAAISKALSGGNPCFGAAAMTSTTPCAASHVVAKGFGADFAASDWGTLAGVEKDGLLPPDVPCFDFSPDKTGYLDCTLGNPNGTHTLAIVGDSHALALLEPLVQIAQQRGWKVRAFVRNSCTPSAPMTYTDPAAGADCNRWRSLMESRIAADSTIDEVVATGFTRAEPDVGFVGSKATLERDYARVWTEWANSGKRVYVVGDVPLTTGHSVPECVAAHANVTDPCAVPRSRALAYDPLDGSVVRAASAKVSLIDLAPQFCDATTCHAVIGGVIAYRDLDHLSGTFALTLIPALKAGLGLSSK